MLGVKNFDSNGEGAFIWLGNFTITPDVLSLTNWVTLEGTYYDYQSGEVLIEAPEEIWSVDWMSDNNNMTWRSYNYPNPGDNYVETLVRSTSLSLSDW